MRGPGTSPKPWTERHDGLVWDDGRIVLVGSATEVRREAQRRGLPVEDLGDRIVLPGFVDAHTHFLHIGVKRHRPDLDGCTSKAEALRRLADWLRAHPGAEPVIGERWDESAWTPREAPTRTDLDRVVAEAAAAGAGPKDRVVVLRRIDGHVAVANSAAMPAIQARWSQPGLVDATTGIVLEQASLYLNEVIGTSDAILDEALGDATRECLALGITTLGDYSQAPYRAALQRAAAAGKLGLRVASSIYVQQLEAEVAGGFRTGRAASPFLRDGGLKMFLDGSLGAHTAALRQPYGDGHGHAHPSGLLNWSDEDALRKFDTAHAAGIQVHAHAIGDAAIDQALRTYATIAAQADLEGAGWHGNALRHRIEHYEIVHNEQVRQTAELGIVASSQPNFVGTWSAKGGMYEDRLGSRFLLNNRFRSFLDAGVAVAFGSDGMPPGPLLGIAAAMGHPDAAQRLDPFEAAWHYTWWSAWALHWEDAVGSLETGKWADIIVVDQSWAKVERTIVAGHIAHP